MHATALLIAALTGVSLAVQIGMNAVVGQRLGHPMWGVIVNFALGTVLLALVSAGMGLRMPASAAFGSVPAWAWMAGLFGAAYVLSSTVIGPLIGGATFLALTVAGQMLAALVIDHYGWIGFPVREISLARVAGAMLVVGGVVVLARS